MNESIRPSTIENKTDLIQFIQWLRSDYQNNAHLWENNNLENYLEALAAWFQDMDGFYQNAGKPVPNQLTWEILADALIAATMYE
jgi:hypothetical protein